MLVCFGWRSMEATMASHSAWAAEAFPAHYRELAIGSHLRIALSHHGLHVVRCGLVHDAVFQIFIDDLAFDGRSFLLLICLIFSDNHIVSRQCVVPVKWR